MNDSPELKTLADEYDQAVRAGQTRITKAWRFLSGRTRDWLTGSRLYDPHGARSTEADGADPHRIEDFEHALGVLDACVKAMIPRRKAAKGTDIPHAARSEEVVRALEMVLYEPRAHEAIFLRLALHALRQYEMANLLMRLPPKSELSGGSIAWLISKVGLTLVLVLLTPAILAFSLSAVAHGEASVATAGFYFLSLVGWLAWLFKGKDDEPPPDERAWSTWERLGFTGIDGSWTSCGVGASEVLRELLRHGARVPPLAFDLCAALTSASLEAQAH